MQVFLSMISMCFSEKGNILSSTWLVMATQHFPLGYVLCVIYFLEFPHGGARELLQLFDKSIDNSSNISQDSHGFIFKQFSHVCVFFFSDRILA